MSEGIIINAGILVTFSSGVLVVIAGFWGYKRLSLEFKLLLLFFVYAVLSNLIIISTARSNLNNLWLFHLYTLFEFIILLWVISFWVQSIRLRQALRLGGIAFFGFWIVSKMTFESLNNYDTVTATVAHIVFIPVALYALYRISLAGSNNLLKDPRFWICVAVLIYSTGNIFWLSLGNEIVSWPKEQMLTAWGIHWMLDILANLFFAGGFWWQAHR